MSRNQSTATLAALALALVAPCFVEASAADAEGPSAPATSQEADALQEVVVTGTRLTTRFAAPTPVTSVTADQ